MDTSHIHIYSDDQKELINDIYKMITSTDIQTSLQRSVNIFVKNTKTNNFIQLVLDTLLPKVLINIVLEYFDEVCIFELTFSFQKKLHFPTITFNILITNTYTRNKPITLFFNDIISNSYNFKIKHSIQCNMNSAMSKINNSYVRVTKESSLKLSDNMLIFNSFVDRVDQLIFKELAISSTYNVFSDMLKYILNIIHKVSKKRKYDDN
jgi:hypothetical protein